MTDIPADVMELARRAIRSSFSLEMGGFEMFNEAYATEQVARAILSERERCAKIAETADHGDTWGDTPWEGGFVSAREEIAEAIRKGG